jgi:hypothetical protein
VTDNQKQYLNLLFRDSDSICYGDIKSTKVVKLSTLFDVENKSPQFIAINAFHGFEDMSASSGTWNTRRSARRADINVIRYSNFLFEFDSISLDEQYRLVEHIGNIFATIVYSGSKSLHCVVSLKNALNIKPHDQQSIQIYKDHWSSIKKYIQSKAIELGLPSEGIVDEACKNPSRLTRFPDSIREDTGKQQCIVKFGKLMSDSELTDILSKFPLNNTKIEKTEEPEILATDLQSFEALCPFQLKNILESPASWAAESGMYPILYRMTLWAIDTTGVSKPVFLSYLYKKTFKLLLQKGYPSHKIEKAVHDAYSGKGIY